MYLYLKLKAAIKRVSNISLADCIKPSIDTWTEDQIDSALWFKVLAIDSIFLDCERRKVYWNSEKTIESERLHHSKVENLQIEYVHSFFQTKDQIFIDSDCYDYDPNVDELFDIASKIFHQLGSEENFNTYANLIKVLHVFILPEIQFQKRDTHILQSVLKEIEQKHAVLEDLIEKTDKAKRNIQHSLSVQRESLLKEKEFSSAKYVSSLDEKFLHLFLKHLEKDCKQLNEAVESNNEAIVPLRDSLAVEDASKLFTLRTKRDDILDSLDRTVKAREEIKNVIARDHVKKKHERNNLGMQDCHELYVKVSGELDNMNQEMNELFNSQIKLSSVRESVLLTLREIDSDGISYGYNQKKGTFEVEVDLFDPSKKPEGWLTLHEKVKTQLHNEQAGFRTQYEQLCKSVKLKVQELFNESEIIVGNSNNISITDPPASISNTQEHNTLSRNSCSSFSFSWSMGTISKDECEALCKEITKHIACISYSLASAIYSDIHVTQCIHSKVYICYEEHVSSELMPVLSALYERCYQDQCLALSEWISHICLDDLGLGEDKLLEIMRYKQNQQRTSTQVSEIEEYQQSFEECERMRQAFPEAIEWDRLYDIFIDDPLATCSGTDLREHDVDLVSNKSDMDVEQQFTSNLVNTPDIQDNVLCDQVTKADITLTVPHRQPSCSNIASNDDCFPQSPTANPVAKQFHQTFDKFYKLIQEEDKVMTVIGKLRQLTRALKFVECQIRKLSQMGEQTIVCADDILDMFILLLCYMDSHWLLKLFAHINLIIHLSPTFMAGNAHDYTLITFSAAYHHLFGQQVLHPSCIEGLESRYS